MAIDEESTASSGGQSRKRVALLKPTSEMDKNAGFVMAVSELPVLSPERKLSDGRRTAAALCQSGALKDFIMRSHIIFGTLCGSLNAEHQSLIVATGYVCKP